jgi:hypothetical protein
MQHVCWEHHCTTNGNNRVPSLTNAYSSFITVRIIKIFPYVCQKDCVCVYRPSVAVQVSDVIGKTKIVELAD